MPSGARAIRSLMVRSNKRSLSCNSVGAIGCLTDRRVSSEMLILYVCYCSIVLYDRGLLARLRVI